MVAIQLNEGFSWRRYLRWLDLRRQAGIWPPSLTALFLQSVALGMVGFGVAPLLALAGWPVSIWLLASVTGLIAFGLSAGLGLARWWWFIQLLFAPLLALFLSWHLAPSWYLAVFLILLLFYWSTFRSQAPLYLSGKAAWRQVALLLPEREGFALMDLGCGVAGMLAYLAEKRSDGRFHGVESAPMPYLISYLRIKFRAIKNCHIAWGNFWSCNLGDYDVVYAYLSPVPMPALWRKARAEMRPGSLLISHTFVVPHVEPSQILRLNDGHDSTMYLWHM